AERLRLAYVAVTRAEHRCHLAWGRVRDGATSPLAWLLHAPPGAGVVTIEDVARRYEESTPAEFDADLARLVARGEGASRVERMDADAAHAPAVRSASDGPPGPARRLHRAVPGGWHTTSFTALSKGLDSERPVPASPRAPSRSAATPMRRDPFGFP